MDDPNNFILIVICLVTLAGVWQLLYRELTRKPLPAPPKPLSAEEVHAIVTGIVAEAVRVRRGEHDERLEARLLTLLNTAEILRQAVDAKAAEARGEVVPAPQPLHRARPGRERLRGLIAKRAARREGRAL